MDKLHNKLYENVTLLLLSRKTVDKKGRQRYLCSALTLLIFHFFCYLSNLSENWSDRFSRLHFLVMCDFFVVTAKRQGKKKTRLGPTYYIEKFVSKQIVMTEQIEKELLELKDSIQKLSKQASLIRDSFTETYLKLDFAIKKLGVCRKKYSECYQSFKKIARVSKNEQVKQIETSLEETSSMIQTLKQKLVPSTGR